MTHEDDYIRQRELCALIGPILHGNKPEVISAALADLLALLLAGHQGGGAAEAREVLLQQFVSCVRDLVPINEQILLKAVAKHAHRTETKQ